jgi:hypothetical protein
MAAHLLFSKRNEVDGQSQHADLIRHGSAQSFSGIKNSAGLCVPEKPDKLGT